MYTITTQQISGAFPETQAFRLPETWFLSLPPGQPVFSIFYQWLQRASGVSNPDTVRKTTFIGKSLFKKLIQAERNRLREFNGYRGDHLDEYVAWVLLEHSAATKLGNCYLRNATILVVPESRLRDLHKLADDLFLRKRRQHISRIKEAARGHNFYAWMLAQTQRPDGIGELARYMDLDVCWPGTVDSLEDLQDYLSNQVPKGLFDRELSAAWSEYLQQYPKRCINKNSGQWTQAAGKDRAPHVTRTPSPHWQ